LPPGGNATEAMTEQNLDTLCNQVDIKSVKQYLQ